MPSKSQETAVPAAPTTFKRRGRIVFTLLAVLVFIGLAPLGTVAWKLIAINREALTTSQQEFQLLLARSIAQQLDGNVEALRDPLVRVASTLSGTIRRHDSRSVEEIERMLGDMVGHRTPYLRYTYFRGREVGSIEAGSAPDGLEPLFTNSLREATEIMAEDSEASLDLVRLSEPELIESESRRSVIVAWLPIVSGGRFRGVLSAVVDLEGVWGTIVSRNRTGHTIFAVDDRGRVFASNNAERVPIGSDVSRSQLVGHYLNSRAFNVTMPFDELENGEPTPYLGSYEVAHEGGWGVFVQAPRSKAYSAVNHMLWSTMRWALAALLMAVLAAMIFAGTLSRPAKRLASASRSFAAGDFTTRVEVRSGNEIGELAFTFNKMAAEIERQLRKFQQAAEENQELFLGTIRALAQAIDAKDPYTRGHSVRVNKYSVIIARQLGLSEREIQDIHVASLMHDVGKIGIDDHILKKNGALTDEEFEIIKTHPVLGANIMAPIGRMQPMLPGLRWHHERWQGNGYPDALTGEEIPLMARIIAVADSFDAMTTHRPYQTAMTFPQALQRLNDLKTLHFEERIVEAFNRAYHQGLIRPDPEEEAGLYDPSEEVAAAGAKA